MKYFVAVDEDTLLRLWMRDPKSVAPFARPFYTSASRGDAKNDPTLCTNVREPSSLPALKSPRV